MICQSWSEWTWVCWTELNIFGLNWNSQAFTPDISNLTKAQGTNLEFDIDQAYMGVMGMRPQPFGLIVYM